MVDTGNPPVLIEVIEAEIIISTDKSNLRVISINDEGCITGTIESMTDNGKIKFKIGGEFAQMYYLIQSQ